jgi:glutathione S-transferase
MLPAFFTSPNADVNTLAICSITLYIKFLATTMIQGRKSFHAQTRCPEDSKIFCATGVQNYGLDPNQNENKELKRAREVENRWKRIVQNDLESIPMALAVFSASVAARANPVINSVLMVTYSVARLGHTYTYANSMQPHRMYVWMAGITCIITAGVNGVVAALNRRY